MQNTSIEWTDNTFNPWIGCTKVSPGCAHCYAEALNKRWRKGANWGPEAPRDRTSADYWKEPLRWNRMALSCGHSDGAYKCPVCSGPSGPHRPRVFCASLADWLDEEVQIEWLCNLLELIHACNNLDWQLLTKRPQNWQSRIEAVLKFAIENENRASRDAERHDTFFHWLNLWLNAHQPPSNIWIGTTVEDQQRAEERIPLLCQIPAKVRFLSCEPLLGEVLLDVINPDSLTAHTWNDFIHWVICGGESGPGANPMHPQWARSLRDQCASAGVPFFFKQWGEWQPYKMGTAYMKGFSKSNIIKNGDGATGWPVYHVGKKAAGRLLDDVEHSEFPKVEVAA